MTQITQDDERGVTYPAMTIAEFDFIDNSVRTDLTRRTLANNALPVIVPILGSPLLNSQIAVALRTSLQKKLWSFLIPDAEAEEYLTKTNKNFIGDSATSDDYAYYMQPYINTTLCIGEAINLDYELRGGLVRLEEKSGSYKDRYSSLAYGNYLISILDKDIMKDKNEEKDDFDEFIKLMPI